MNNDTSKHERFSNFCSLLETLQKKTGRSTKIFQKDIIQRYFNVGLQFVINLNFYIFYYNY